MKKNLLISFLILFLLLFISIFPYDIVNQKIQKVKVQKELEVEIETKLIKITEENINYYYKTKLTLPDFRNSSKLTNFKINIEVDTLTLIRGNKLDLDCNNLFFTDSENYLIPHWIEKNIGRTNTSIWIRVPSIGPNEKKVLFFCYGKKNVQNTYSNFKNVFTKEDGLMCWYYFNNLLSEKVLDYSGNKNNGILSRIEYGRNWSGTLPDEDVSRNKSYIFFNSWWFDYREIDNGGYEYKRKSTFFTIPNDKLMFDKLNGTIEMYINPYPVFERDENYYGNDDDNFTKVRRIILDKNGGLELGINEEGELYFNLNNIKNGKKYAYCKNPLKSGEWNHLIITWSKNINRIMFFVNGNEIDSITKNNQIIKWKMSDYAGDLYIGGTNLEIGSSFAGNIDGLKLYSRQLDQDEIKNAYEFNTTNIRFPKIQFGKEEKFKLGEENKLVNLTDVLSSAQVSKKIKYNLYYAGYKNKLNEEGEVEYYYRNYYFGENYKDPSSGVISSILSKHHKEYIPIFGLTGHFYSYEGTPIYSDGSFLLQYISFDINDIELIGGIKIEIKEIYSHLIDISKHNLIDILFPSAYACGPGYGYRPVGDSDLIYDTYIPSNHTHWFKLKVPILITKNNFKNWYTNLENISIFQIYLKPAGKEGNLKIKVNDMIFSDNAGKYLKSSSSNEIKGTEREYEYIKEKADAFEISLVSEEKGYVTFLPNKITNNLDIVFKNIGSDEINISKYSIDGLFNKSFYNSTVTSIDIINESNYNVFKRISANEIENFLIGKSIPSGKERRLSFAKINDLIKDSKYQKLITVNYKERDNGKYYLNQFGDYTNISKIIFWLFTEDPYDYPSRIYNRNSAILHKLIIKNGDISISPYKENSN